ncbi:MAG TPA: heme o synthase [Actinomycetota bacterium]|nr:heme o synthase [Actinomycetota bacterium]
MKRTFRSLATATVVVTLLLIAWGGVVRATGSGDGCPDWPQCYGSWIPRAEYHTLIEYAHRFLAFVAGCLTLALGITGAWSLLRHRDVDRAAAIMAVILLPLFLAQAAIGGWIIASHEDPAVVTIHFAVAFLVLGLGVAIVSRTRLPVGAGQRGYGRLTAATAIATYALLLVGTYVRAEGVGLAFREWPLMGDSIVPDLQRPGGTAMFVHRVLAVVVVALYVWCVVRARTMQPRSPLLVRLSTVALVLLGVQVLVGGANVVTELATWARATHVGLSALIWSAVVALAMVARVEPAADREALQGAPQTAGTEETASLGDSVRAYVALTKPRIIVLLLVITVPAMVLAGGGVPAWWLIAVTLIGGTLAAAAANAMNMYLDRDIDQVMRRTRARPLPRHRIAPEAALRFGFVLAACSYLFLAITVNVLAALLALSAIAFYVFVYTMWLKRSTDQNIVIGGAAGAVPVLVGWAAVTGAVALPAVVLFAVVFVWTPPHFWALALRMRDDYAAAGVPMLPVVRGADETRRQIFLYSLALFGTTLLLVPIAGMGPLYVATAVVLGGTFVYRCLQLWRAPSDDRSWRVFTFSMLYLAGLFAAVALDVLA